MDKKLDSFIVKHEKMFLSIILLLCLIYTSFFLFHTTTQWSQDSYWYMSLAKNMVLGQGYSFDGHTPHSQYPPGLPLLLIPLFLILKNIHLSGILVILVLSFLTLLITYKVGKLINPIVALLATIFLLFHNLFISFTTSILTEIPFAFFSLFGLYLFIKGFENQKYFLFAFPVIAFTCLIRYDGFFLIFPMIYYSFVQRKKFKQLIKTDSVIIGITLGCLILGTWFLRNFLSFGNPFYTSYSGYSLGLGFSSIYSFAKLFFNIGFLFPIFAIIGAYFIIKEKNKVFITLIIWFFSYLFIHSLWGFKLLRFYSEILPIICIFAAYGVIKIISKVKSKKRFFAILIVLIILSSQLFIFLNPNLGAWNGNNLLPRMNIYEPIKDVCEWSNKNLPDSAIYLVPDLPSYSFYLNKQNILDYYSGFENLFKNPNRTHYFLVDTIHSWITQRYLVSKNGSFSIIAMDSSKKPIKVDFNTELLDESSSKRGLLGQLYKNHSSFIVEIKNFSAKIIN